MNQWIKIFALTGVLALTTTSIALAKFNDIAENTIYEKAINNLVEEGIINGYPDNTFKPDGKITRAEFSKILYVMENLELKENNEKDFEDIAEHWANSYIEVAASNDLLKGYEDNTFKPDKEITYGEVATILLRVLDLYEEKELAINWPNNCMQYASELGLFDGVQTNDLLGVSPARRDNVALMVWNTINYKNNIEQDISGDNVIEDNTNDDKENNVSEKINTKTLHIGSVEAITIRRGEKYIVVKNIDGEEEEIKLYSKSAEPQMSSFIVYKLKSNGEMNLTKELLVDEIPDVAFIVEEVENELVRLQGEENLLDLNIDKFKSSITEIRLTKYTYYLVDMLEENDEYLFDSFEQVSLEKLNLKKEDRLCFDEDTKIALVIRGIGE